LEHRPVHHLGAFTSADVSSKLKVLFRPKGAGVPEMLEGEETITW